LVDKVDDGALAATGWGSGGGGEVELGPGPVDVARGVVIGERGGLGGREGVEPDADALDGVADLGGTLAPRGGLVLVLELPECGLEAVVPLMGTKWRRISSNASGEEVEGKGEGAREERVGERHGGDGGAWRWRKLSCGQRRRGMGRGG